MAGTKGGGGTNFCPVTKNSIKRLQVLCVFTLGEGHHAGEWKSCHIRWSPQPNLLTIIPQRGEGLSPQRTGSALAGTDLHIAEESFNSESR